eukprot:gnl/Chilomastix_cuspidata/1028.p1 GENE.gnl/Chilomastix_cuspidata/1028~~gnl/Chilomastix_cuspidata/1028.p1  ORF type:complete len:1236 (-),score=481.03 gnl/Chilomastix_cuspidata/1028:1355-5032(-)
MASGEHMLAPDEGRARGRIPVRARMYEPDVPQISTNLAELSNTPDEYSSEGSPLMSRHETSPKAHRVQFENPVGFSNSFGALPPNHPSDHASSRTNSVWSSRPDTALRDLNATPSSLDRQRAHSASNPTLSSAQRSRRNTTLARKASAEPSGSPFAAAGEGPDQTFSDFPERSTDDLRFAHGALRDFIPESMAKDYLRTTIHALRRQSDAKKENILKKFRNFSEAVRADYMQQLRVEKELHRAEFDKVQYTNTQLASSLAEAKRSRDELLSKKNDMIKRIRDVLSEVHKGAEAAPSEDAAGAIDTFTERARIATKESLLMLQRDFQAQSERARESAFDVAKANRPILQAIVDTNKDESLGPPPPPPPPIAAAPNEGEREGAIRQEITECGERLQNLRAQFMATRAKLDELLPEPPVCDAAEAASAEDKPDEPSTASTTGASFASSSPDGPEPSTPSSAALTAEPPNAAAAEERLHEEAQLEDELAAIERQIEASQRDLEALQADLGKILFAKQDRASRNSFLEGVHVLRFHLSSEASDAARAAAAHDAALQEEERRQHVVDENEKLNRRIAKKLRQIQKLEATLQELLQEEPADSQGAQAEIATEREALAAQQEEKAQLTRKLEDARQQLAAAERRQAALSARAHELGTLLTERDNGVQHTKRLIDGIGAEIDTLKKKARAMHKKALLFDKGARKTEAHIQNKQQKIDQFTQEHQAELERIEAQRSAKEALEARAAHLAREVERAIAANAALHTRLGSRGNVIADIEKVNAALVAHTKQKDLLNLKIEKILQALKNEQRLSRQLKSLLQKLRHKVIIYLRVPPAEARGDAAAQDTEHAFLSFPDEFSVSFRPRPDSLKVFEFDRCFPPDAGQRAVFSHVRPYVGFAMEGFNASICSYGQAAAGKTHTMVGPSGGGDPGVIPLALEHMFQSIEASTSHRFHVAVYMAELYNNRLVDLLFEGDDRDAHDASLRVLKNAQGHVKIQNITVRDAKSAVQAFELFNLGYSSRAATRGLPHGAGRSHLFFSLVVHAISRNNKQTFGKLTFADLAGPARVRKEGATGPVLKEAQNINSSLMALGGVVSALAAEEDRVPYTGHTLTRLLSDALGGNSHTLVLVSASPLRADLEETTNSLIFASRLRQVSNIPSQTVKPVLAHRLETQIERLRGGQIFVREVTGEEHDDVLDDDDLSYLEANDRDASVHSPKPKGAAGTPKRGPTRAARVKNGS